MSVYPQPNNTNDVLKRVQLSAGSTIVYVCPPGFNSIVEKIIAHTPAANDVSLSIVGSSTVKVYDFSLSADDTLVDTNAYKLFPSEKISISNTSSLDVVIEAREYYIFAPR